MSKSSLGSFPLTLACIVAAACASAAPTAAAEATRAKPNIVFILADDLGYGEVGCFGQKVIRTPRLDRMAAEGLRFTQFYAGSTVCAPSRSVLMTGQHVGHTRVRGNAGRENPEAQMLRDSDVTVAEVLKSAGYATALIGKWGLGMPGDEGVPNKQGFDYFYGYLSQTHAHNHYPDYLWRNDERVPLENVVTPIGDGGGYATLKRQYSTDLFIDESLKYVAAHREQPFFLYLALTTPHANNEKNREQKDGTEVPDFGIYAGEPWPAQDRGHAAMVTYLDTQVGRVLDELKSLGLDKNTLVLFSSDNGPHKESSHDLTRFDPSGPVTGTKRSLTDGGIRVPTLAWWPGTIEGGRTSDHVAYFGDFMATAAELAGADLAKQVDPATLDSISFVPTLFNNEPSHYVARPQAKHPFLYWEFHEGGPTQQAVRLDDWKGIRAGGGPVRLYDLKTDLGETTDVAAEHPDVARRIERIMATSHAENEHWPLKTGGGKNGAGKKKQSQAGKAIQRS